MSETDRTEGRPDAAFTEAATGAESTYVHGGQRPLENPPRAGASDVSLPAQDELNQMHVDSKLLSGEAPIPGNAPDAESTWREDDTRLQARRDFGNPVGNSSADPTKVGALNHPFGEGQAEPQKSADEFGRSPEQVQDLQKRRDEAFKKQDDAVQARQASAAAINEVHNDVRDRTLAVQEEIATRERDGATPGTPAFERRKERIRQIVGETGGSPDGGEGAQGSPADRLRAVAARLHTYSASGIEEAQHELMALASELDGGREKAA